jgi:hypothetical protein
MVQAARQWWWTEAIVEYHRIVSYSFLSNKLISYVAFYVGPIQTGFMMTFRKSYGGTGIVIPVKKTPQERKTQESGEFLQEYATLGLAKFATQFLLLSRPCTSILCTPDNPLNASTVAQRLLMFWGYSSMVSLSVWE